MEFREAREKIEYYTECVIFVNREMQGLIRGERFLKERLEEIKKGEGLLMETEADIKDELFWNRSNQEPIKRKAELYASQIEPLAAEIKEEIAKSKAALTRALTAPLFLRKGAIEQAKLELLNFSHLYFEAEGIRDALLYLASDHAEE